jgi:hypothetical protein
MGHQAQRVSTEFPAVCIRGLHGSRLDHRAAKNCVKKQGIQLVAKAANHCQKGQRVSRVRHRFCRVGGPTTNKLNDLKLDCKSDSKKNRALFIGYVVFEAMDESKKSQ